MKIIGIIGQKGGCGKSHLAISLGVLADKNKGFAAILDVDPQGTVKKWSERRESSTPIVLETTSTGLDEAIDAAREDNIDYLFIDTPPHVGKAIELVVKKSDLVLVPVRPDPSNLDALDGTWNIVSKSNAALAVLNGVPTDSSTDGNDLQAFLEEAFPELSVAENRLHQRKQYWQPHLQGKAVSELSETLATMKAHAEIKNLWNEIKKGLK